MEPLTAAQVRVLSCLVEKQRTVPDAYPMSLNGLRTACNQSSNRDPVVHYDEIEVQRALDGLKERRLVRFVHPAAGERVTKFRHVLDEALGLDDAELAVVALLALRGPQTVGELRTRSERLHPFASLEQVDDTLESLATRDAPLVVALPRRPGDRQQRWAHLLAGEPSEPTAPLEGDAAGPVQTTSPAGAVGSREVADRLEELTDQVAALTERLAALERELGLAP